MQDTAAFQLFRGILEPNQTVPENELSPTLPDDANFTLQRKSKIQRALGQIPTAEYSSAVHIPGR
jgi:hypothetical protein